jgi:hypothetical protein
LLGLFPKDAKKKNILLKFFANKAVTLPVFFIHQGSLYIHENPLFSLPLSI